MDHFPDLTHRVAAQTVELANMGMGEWPHGGAGELPASGNPHLCRSDLATEMHLRILLSLPQDYGIRLVCISRWLSLKVMFRKGPSTYSMLVLNVIELKNATRMVS